MLKSMFVTSFSAIALVAATPVVAASRSADAIGISVFTGDLDLTTNAGQSALQDRVDRATDTICRLNGSRDLRARLLITDCKTRLAQGVAPEVEGAIARAYETKKIGKTAQSSIKITG